MPHVERFFFRYRAESAMPIRALIVMSFVSSATPGVPRCTGSVMPALRMLADPRSIALGLKLICVAM